MRRRILHILLLVPSLLLHACGGGEEGKTPPASAQGAPRGSAAEASVDSARVRTARVLDLDSTTIDVFRAGTGVVVLEFGGRRCIACNEMRSNLTELQTKRSDIRVGFVYWEESPELFERWKVGLIPAQVVLDAAGDERLRHQGVWETESMFTALKDLR